MDGGRSKNVSSASIGFVVAAADAAADVEFVALLLPLIAKPGGEGAPLFCAPEAHLSQWLPPSVARQSRSSWKPSRMMRERARGPTITHAASCSSLQAHTQSDF